MDKVLDQLLSGKMSIKTRIRYTFDRFKNERKRLAQIIKDIVLEIEDKNLPYTKYFLQNPYSYSFVNFRSHKWGDSYGYRIRLNLDRARNGNYDKLKGVVLHENVHRMDYEDLDSENDFWCVFSHSLEFFKKCKAIGYEMPDLYFKCDKCGSEMEYRIIEKTEDNATPVSSEVEKYVGCVKCGNVLFSKDSARDTVIFLNYDSLLSKGQKLYLLSALSHPYMQNPANVTIKNGDVTRLACVLPYWK